MRSRIYALDVGAYARAPLLHDHIRGLARGSCIVTQAVIDIFNHKLRASIDSFTANYRSLRTVLRKTLSRHMRRRAHVILAQLESIRRGREDAFLYTVLHALLSDAMRGSRGRLTSAITEAIHEARHGIQLLDMLYAMLETRKDAIANSIAAAFRTYAENRLGCRTGIGPGLAQLLPAATKISMQLGQRDADREDIAMILSLCTSLEQEDTEAYKLTILTYDYKLTTLVHILAQSHNILREAGYNPDCIDRITVKHLE